MTHRLLATALVFSLSASVAAGSNPKKDFVEALEDKTVVLATDLYTIHYTYVRFGTDSHTPASVGVLTFAPDKKEAFYSGKFGKKELEAANINELVAKVSQTMAKGPGFLGEVFGNMRNQKVLTNNQGANFTRYEAGSRFVVKKVDVKKDEVVVELMNEVMHPTAVRIKWPGEFSKDFTESEQVYELLSRALKVEGHPITTTASR